MLNEVMMHATIKFPVAGFLRTRFDVNDPAVLRTPTANRTLHRGIDGRISSTADPDGESPLRRARRLRLSIEFATLSPITQHHLRRVADATKLTPPIADILDLERAPFLVCRWVAEGRWLQDRVVRLALALLLRQEVRADRPGRAVSCWAWARDGLYCTAERIFWQSPQAQRLVKCGLLVDKGSVPTQGGPLFTVHWPQSWAAVQREFSGIDRGKFLDQVRAVVAQRKRRRVRKQPKLNDRERAYVQALEVIKRGVLRRDITLDDAAAALFAKSNDVRSSKKRSSK